MARIFRKLFNLFPGEEKSALSFALLGFLWAIAVTSGLKFADALFLLHIGPESLPIAYSISATFMILIASLLIWGFNNFSAEKIFLAALSLGTVFYLTIFTFFYLKIGLESSWLWYLLRVFGSINFAVIVTCFWTFVDQYFHLQDAKRLFSLFSSMVFLGIATTGFVMLSGLIDFQTLSLIIAFVLTLTCLLVVKVSRTLTPVYDDVNAETDQVSLDVSIKDLVQSILRSKFTLLLMSSNILIYLLLVTTEFNYYSTFDRYFAPPPGSIIAGDEADAQLTQFLGKALMGVSMTNLLFGLFFYSRLLRRFGIGFLLPITPLMLILTYSGWVLDDALVFALMGYFVVEGTLYVIDDSNFNLLLNAVPTRLKYKIRVLIESFFEPVGTLLAAGLLSLSWINSKLLGLILSVILMGIVIFIRRAYLKAIYHNLAENAIHFNKTVYEWFQGLNKKEKKGAESRLFAILRHREEEDKSFALKGLIEAEERSSLKKLAHEVGNLSSEEKVQFIKTITETDFASDVVVIETVQEWMMDENDPRLLREIYWFLAKLGLLHPDKVSYELDSPDLKLKGSAVLALKCSSADLTSEESLRNKTIAYQKIKELLDSEEEKEIRMGLRILSIDASQNDLEIVLAFLEHPEPLVEREAARTLMHIAGKKALKSAYRFSEALTKTSDSETRLYLLKALAKIGDSAQVPDIVLSALSFRPNERRVAEETIASMGLKNVPLLLSLLKDRSLPDRSRLVAGKALGRIAGFQLRAQLETLLKPEIERALFYYTHWHTVQKDNPEIDLSLLEDTLRGGYFSALDFIIQLLGVSGEIEDSEMLSRSMRSHKPKVRSQVIEALEKTCEPKIFRLLLPLLEESPQVMKIHYYLKIGGEGLSLSQLLDKMCESSSLADEIVAYSFMHKLNKEGWQEMIKKHMTKSEEIFQHFAYELLES